MNDEEMTSRQSCYILEDTGGRATGSVSSPQSPCYPNYQPPETYSLNFISEFLRYFYSFLRNQQEIRNSNEISLIFPELWDEDTGGYFYRDIKPASLVLKNQFSRVRERLLKVAKENFIAQIYPSLDKEIEEILALGDNWDEEGSISYKRSTLSRAKTVVEELLVTSKKIKKLPQILPGSKGNVDIHWKTEGFEILITIPEDEHKSMYYYGDNYGKIRIKGTIDANGLPALAKYINDLL